VRADGSSFGVLADPSNPSLRAEDHAFLIGDDVLLEPLTLLVSLDANGRAQGVLYEDAGDGYGYQNGDYLFTTYSAEQAEGEVRVRIESEEGDRARPERTVAVVVITDDGEFEGSGSETSTITVPLQ